MSANSYTMLLTSIPMYKLPAEMRLTVSREVTEEMWNMEEVMRVVNHEISTRERSFASGEGPTYNMYLSRTHPQRLLHQREPPPTATTLMAGHQGVSNCVYYSQSHQSNACGTVTSIEARRDPLQRGVGVTCASGNTIRVTTVDQLVFAVNAADVTTYSSVAHDAGSYPSPVS